VRSAMRDEAEFSVAVTGGAGFIGSAVCRRLARQPGYRVVNIDNLTYAGNLANVAEISNGDNYAFYQSDICDSVAMRRILQDERVDAVLHLAAESHVDRSIDGAASFIATNIGGTFSLLEAARDYWSGLAADQREAFRFIHVSTDEVYGDLQADDPAFLETTPYDPSSPYSASKAASDHLASAWFRTYGLPVIITNCSNNYGPFHFPEKLIPRTIINAIEGRPVPVYGNGHNIRDWLHVDDHAAALELVLRAGRPGERYNIGGNAERRNIDVVRGICDALDTLYPRPDQMPREQLIDFVEDRPGHDFRYAVDTTRIATELGWRPSRSFETGIKDTVEWYIANEAWWRPSQSNSDAGRRLGLIWQHCSARER
jgi:dTDP-glucose 4,6-dehydratase